jgi:hypothetical protein
MDVPLVEVVIALVPTLLECCNVSVVLVKASEANEVRMAARR